MDPHRVIVTTRDNKDDIRVLSYSYHTTITGWGVLLSSNNHGNNTGTVMGTPKQGTPRM